MRDSSDVREALINLMIDTPIQLGKLKECEIKMLMKPRLELLILHVLKSPQSNQVLKQAEDRLNSFSIFVDLLSTMVGSTLK